MKKKEGVINGR
ncbi:Protein CBG25857 [Caenorhabditis briggsae]|uniref:Protein CBG25857 n=1 Tax=Caenorhabditis briggsae TaxID=6238 RepID=B6IIT4_CAEBR|nr:Protein CBG25857 [Caenorhabditis briggsae]CAR99814.1 Protein CBG25857 [Caenorhabditis briggsae]